MTSRMTGPAMASPQCLIIAAALLLLRNTSVINFLDRCAITVPIRTVGPPLGLMIVGEHGGDRHLLGVGRGIEAALNRTL